jgi:hypothetical protein
MFYTIKRPLIAVLIAALIFIAAVPSFGEENPRGLAPVMDATYMPDLGGILNKTYHNQYGQKRDLSECIVLRRSKIKDGKAYVPAGGLFYSSETSYDARPFMREPFLILGEHTYLLRLSYKKVIKRNVEVKKGEKLLLDSSGYRLWFEYATDHYEKPYGEFALISPSGGWPHEWPISTSFPGAGDVKKLKLKEGIHPQLKPFFMSATYLYGLTKLVAEDVGFEKAKFSMIEYPVVTEAVFSMERPWVMNIYQESFRWYGNKRIYTFRKKDGILVEIRNWTGKKVLASKLLKPLTQQEYKVANQDDYCLTDFDLDIHIELIVDPSYYKASDFAPWANDVPYGWQEGTVSLAVYNDLVKIEDGKPWPMDNRYIVRLEANYETGMLKRLVLENREPFILSNDNATFDGPEKISEVWDRKYFKLVAKDFEKDVVKNCYVRDSFFQRTDNLILWKDGRDNIDFFIGKSPLVISVMEDTFLQRLADPSYDIPVVQSRFTSYPEVIPDAKWFAPDPTCSFVPNSELKGFIRKYVKTREGKRLISQETMVIRRSYVDYRNRKIIIPSGGLYYSARDNRNIRPGEPLKILGKDAYLLGFKSYLVVKRDFKIDLWKEYPMGDGNPLFWQDMAFGDGSKAMRYMSTNFLWGRTLAELRVTKYSGNNWSANVLVAHGLNSYEDLPKTLPDEGIYEQDFKYFIPDVFAEGATYLIPKFISPDFVEVEEMGTPGMDEFTVTYKKPKKAVLRQGEWARSGKYRFKVDRINTGAKSVKCSLTDSQGNIVAEKTFGPLDDDLLGTLPQYAPSQDRITMKYEDMVITLHIPVDLSTGKAVFYLATDSVTYEKDKPWPEDPRFMVRPDVCGHCYQLNEVILDNKDPIVLDADNPEFDGPGGYFKIVIDDFDGEAINAWHIETKRKNKKGEWITSKTGNLAEYPRNNIDVMVGVNGTTESFLRRTVLERLSYREIWRLK